jgi:hypothetical protein
MALPAGFGSNTLFFRCNHRKKIACQTTVTNKKKTFFFLPLISAPSMDDKISKLLHFLANQLIC